MPRPPRARRPPTEREKEEEGRRRKEEEGGGKRKVVRVPPELVGEVLEAADRALRPMGGRLNLAKCKAWSPGAEEPPGLPAGLWQRDGLLLLGTPHGEGPNRGEDAPLPLGAGVVQQHLDKVLASYRIFLAGLEQVVRDAPPKDARVQSALLLLRLCGQGKVAR